MSDGLPAEWKAVRLADVVDVCQSGFASGQKNVPGGVNHLRMNNIGVEGKLVLDLIRTVPRYLAASRHFLRKGDVLVCTTNSGKLVGKCAYFNLDGQYAYSNHITRLAPKSELVDGHFLQWYLWLLWKSGEFETKSKHWVNQSTIPKDELLTTEVILPPLAEQRRIVAKLDELLGSVEECRQRLDRIPLLMKQFRQAVLKAACEGKLNGKSAKRRARAGWREVVLEDILVDFRTGPFGSALHRADYVVGGIPVINPSNLIDGRIMPSREIAVSMSTLKRLEAYVLAAGDIVIARRGEMGRCAVVSPREQGWLCGTGSAALRLSTEAMPEFVAMWLSSPDSRAYLAEIAVGSTMQNLNQRAIRSVPILLPTKSEQRIILARVDVLFRKANEVEYRSKALNKRLERVTASILARAFRGVL